VRWLNRHALVTLPAQFDQANAERIRELLQSLLSRDLLVLIVDMSGTAECNHACGEVLACVYQRAMITGTDLRLVVTSNSLRRVLAIVGLDGIVPVYSSVAAALAATVPADVPPAARTAGHEEHERWDVEAGRAVPPGHDPEVEIALLDRDGVIVWVNHAWQAFAAANGGDPDRTGTGVSYLDVCAAAPNDPGSAQVDAAIRRALTGDLPGALTVEVPCHSPDTARWFDLLISPRRDDDGQSVGATVTLSLGRSQNRGTAGPHPQNRG
jgi:anti-anti-sigma factor